MNRRAFVAGLGAVLAAPLAVEAQPARIYRVGVVLQGGVYSAAINGLRDGSKISALRKESSWFSTCMMPRAI